ncbi:hypothetical protein JNK62_03505 [bacterium]|nr:hypothetical protein [bacterium]
MTTKKRTGVRARAREFAEYILEISASPKDWKKFCDEAEKSLKKEARGLEKKTHLRQARRLRAMAGSFESLSFCGY